MARCASGGNEGKSCTTRRGVHPLSSRTTRGIPRKTCVIFSKHTNHIRQSKLANRRSQAGVNPPVEDATIRVASREAARSSRRGASPRALRFRVGRGLSRPWGAYAGPRAESCSAGPLAPWKAPCLRAGWRSSPIPARRFRTRSRRGSSRPTRRGSRGPSEG